jgi:hypothetical protein
MNLAKAKAKSKSVSVNTPIGILSFKMPLAATHSNQNWKLKSVVFPAFLVTYFSISETTLSVAS